MLGSNGKLRVRVGLSGQIHQEPYPRLGDLVDEIGPIGHWNLYDAKRQPDLPRSQEVLAVIKRHPERKDRQPAWPVATLAAGWQAFPSGAELGSVWLREGFWQG